MENPMLSLKQLQAVELQGESILRDRAEVVALERRRNGNREALRALASQAQPKKVWFTLGPMLVKIPVSSATSLLNKDQVVINSEVNKIRSDLKVKVNKLRDLEFESPVPGIDLKPLSSEEMAAVRQVLGGHS